MKKRFCALVLCAVVLLGSLPALAAGDLLIGGLSPVRAYDGRFDDVAQNSWYYDNVACLYELGLTQGQSASSFGVSSPITIAEALSFAARLRSAYYSGDPEAGARTYAASDGPWYAPYIQYLSASGFPPAAEFAGGGPFRSLSLYYKPPKKARVSFARRKRRKNRQNEKVRTTAAPAFGNVKIFSGQNGKNE